MNLPKDESTGKISRRQALLGFGALLPLSASAAFSKTAFSRTPPESKANPGADALPPPKYTLSPNLEIMLSRKLSHVERLEMVAREGAKAYSFWHFEHKDIQQLRDRADELGMRCGSIAGSGQVGRTTGLTAPGKEKVFLDYFTRAVAAAKVVGTRNLVTFVGARLDDVPWKKQYAQIISGLRKAGDIAGEAGVYLTLEPLSRVESPEMTVLSAQEGFQILREVDHPHVKLDFDMYHLQLSEGNLTNNLREGLKDGLIQFVEIGDVPGRFEPGTGEVNYQHIFNVLRELGYDGYVGLEHRSKKNFPDALATVRRMAGVSSQ